MSYVGDLFEWDVFVSYGRANREGDTESALREWSLAFANQLKKYLLGPKRFSREPERTLRVFLDESEDGIHALKPLTPQIRDAAASSAILLTLMSEDYLASDWCMQELQAWDANQIALEIPGSDRIAVARIEPTTESLWHKRLRDPQGVGLLGYRFHEWPKNSKQVVLPYGHPIPNARTDEAFQGPFFDLVDDIWGRLEALRDELNLRREARRRAAKLNEPEPLLYLHGRAAQRPDWETHYTRLIQGGFIVAPSSVDPEPVHHNPADELAFYKERLGTMKNCDALLLMSTENGAAFDNDLTFIGRQARFALKGGDVPLMPCALLNSVVQPARTQNRRVLAERLDVKWIDSTHSGWLPEVRTWLDTVSRKNGKSP